MPPAVSKERRQGRKVTRSQCRGVCSGTGHCTVMMPMSWAVLCPERAAVWPSLGQEGMSSGRRDLTGGGLSFPLPVAVLGPQRVLSGTHPWTEPLGQCHCWLICGPPGTRDFFQLGDASNQCLSGPNALLGNLGWDVGPTRCCELAGGYFTPWALCSQGR